MCLGISELYCKAVLQGVRYHAHVMTGSCASEVRGGKVRSLVVLPMSS